MTDTTSAEARPAMGALEIVAVAVSASTIVAAAIFWVIQIQGVLEMLRLAYG